MNAKQKIHQAKMAKWAALINNQLASGMSVRQWCGQNGYTIHAYNYWKHLLKETALRDVSLPEIVPLTPPSGVSPPLPSQIESNELPSLNKRDLRESCQPSHVSISLGGIRIDIGSGESYDVICGIIEAVRHA